MMDETYNIIRFYRDDRPNRVIAGGVTLEEARAHCNDPESSSRTATAPDEDGDWFDGYEER
jgi:hypothetical protein